MVFGQRMDVVEQLALRPRFAARRGAEVADRGHRVVRSLVALGHFVKHHLGGAAADGEHACVAPEALDDRVAHVAHAAVELLATLNHLLVGEHRLWYVRFAQGLSPQLALDAEEQSDRARLAGQLIEGVQRWAPLVAGWPDPRFDGMLEYTTTRGVPARLPFAATLTHVFNHGTHHRGQITAALTALGQPCPELDLVWMLQAESRSTS